MSPGGDGPQVAEDRLRGSNKEFVYLTRKSDIKKGKFILSTLTGSGSSVKHTIAPNPSARKNFKSLGEGGVRGLGENDFVQQQLSQCHSFS